MYLLIPKLWGKRINQKLVAGLSIINWMLFFLPMEMVIGLWSLTKEVNGYVAIFWACCVPARCESKHW
ncbi:hypothetical protein V428_16035 [Aeromonas hydrophila subsp. hydrophila AL09-71]|nr:hypothetical protein V428_16035 [Aeromonas hydrophila subsp. hydrophila AL09-71]AHX70321.1 hypothetical protein V429_16070 [Aeromonas hydrophila pc104A]ALQ62709.1 hypothetical protein AS145_07340 [Aeromonas hydrophila]ALZ79410.1 hypothetical protein AhyD4_07305 [Aeromonas hydrophila]AXV29318.1 hypothetical protein BFW97_07340 [Aeromonas hydrophila]